MAIKAKLPMGVENFGEIRTMGYYYIDKCGRSKTGTMGNGWWMMVWKRYTDMALHAIKNAVRFALDSGKRYANNAAQLFSGLIESCT